MADGAFVPAPYLNAPRSYSGDSLSVEVGCIDSDARLYYAIGDEDGRTDMAPVEGPSPCTEPKWSNS